MSYPCLSLAVKFMCRPLFFVALRQNRYLNIEVTVESRVIGPCKTVDRRKLLQSVEL